LFKITKAQTAIWSQYQIMYPGAHNEMHGTALTG